MRKFASIVVLLGVTLLALAGCGGDSGCGSLTSGTGTSSSTNSCGTGGTQPTGVPATLEVTTTTTNIPGDGSASATINALVTDSSGAAVSGTSVTFVASAGTLSASSGTTDSTGKTSVTLVAGKAAPGTPITVTATAGTLTGSTTVTVAAAAQQSITLATSSPTISSDNSVPVTVTAFVKDANNNFVAGATVDFSATSGGLSVNSGGVTDANGSATASLSVAGDPSTRTITVTAAANGASSTINVGVVGTSLTLDGPTSLVQGTPGTYTITLTDSGNKGIAAVPVAVSSSAGNTLSASSVTTDTTGHATFTVTATKPTTDTLTATALGTSAALPVQVSSQQFSFTAPASQALIPIVGSPCTPNVPVSVNFTSGGAPIADGTPVTFSSTRGTLSSANATTVGGVATVNICATTAGPATLSAAATPAAPAAPVSATEVVNFISTSPSALNLQASPQTVSINGKSTFTAVVRDAAGNLVQNQEVDFTLTDTTGGQLSVGSAVTDVEGVATTVYTAGTTASSANGVSVIAKLQTNGAVTDTATLTVSGAALHISFGTGQKIRENGTSSAFLQDWFVTVVDSSGASVPNKAVTLTLHSASRPHFAYFKGAYEVCGTSWVPYDGVTRGCDPSGKLALTQPTACFNEDLDLSGVYNSAEDINHDNVLEPGDIAIVTTNPIVTGADGTATFTIEWPEDHSQWVAVDLTATASVAGTESSSTTSFVLPVLATYLTTITSSPPGAVSPYGVGACTDPP
ncbi:MAG TPA: Ig-like domain-containing protein [Steroidobacteraceae bacterium]